MEHTEIEAAIMQNQPAGLKIHFDHAHDAILWFDIKTHSWCVSFYITTGTKVEVDLAPVMSFKRPLTRTV